MSNTSKSISVTRTRLGIATCLGIALLMYFAVPVHAGEPTLKDFQAAARGSGCDLIPYDDLQTNCHGAYGEVREWCKGDKEKGCGKLDPGKEEDRAIAKERKDNAIECLKKREYLKEKIYDVALEKLDRDESHSDVPEIRPLATEIIKKIKAGQEDHEQVMVNTKERRDKCQKVEDNR